MAEPLRNADFSQRVALATEALPWEASPQPGVERRILDRVGGEVARATSLVRYAPGSAFPEHEHALGEEFLVLEGVFADEHGDYPAGAYVRNPPASRHSPRTDGGCVIFVKLRQMSPAESARVVVDTAAFVADATGPARLPLFDAPRSGESVAIERLRPGETRALHAGAGGEEILVLAGDLADAHGSYGKGAWIRTPHGMPGSRRSSAGAVFWVKRGHLPDPSGAR